MALSWIGILMLGVLLLLGGGIVSRAISGIRRPDSAGGLPWGKIIGYGAIPFLVGSVVASLLVVRIESSPHHQRSAQVISQRNTYPEQMKFELPHVPVFENGLPAELPRSSFSHGDSYLGLRPLDFVHLLLAVGLVGMWQAWSRNTP